MSREPTRCAHPGAPFVTKCLYVTADQGSDHEVRQGILGVEITSKEDFSILPATKGPKMDEAVHSGGEVSAIGTIQAEAGGCDVQTRGSLTLLHTQVPWGSLKTIFNCWDGTHASIFFKAP